jgi:N-methylhydantoinase A/oxoprolinase/acetone carboxylase beta subunit
MMGEGIDAIAAWRVAALGGEEQRILVQFVKREFLHRVQKAMEKHGMSLASLIHPAVATWHSWLHQQAEATDQDAVLIDVGGQTMHVGLLHHGELILFRTQQSGQEELVSAIAGNRGVDAEAARQILCRLGSQAPEDLLALVKRSASTTATAVTAALRSGQAQLKLTAYKPEIIYIAGAGARGPAFVQALEERLKMKARLINPFAGITAGAGDILSKYAQLPSPWVNVIGAAVAAVPQLDVCQTIQEQKRQWWQTQGLLRVAAIFAVVAVVATIAMGTIDKSRSKDVLTRLKTSVPPAQEKEKILNASRAAIDSQRKHLEFLARQTFVPRLAQESLEAVARSIHPQTQRVILDKVAVRQVGPDAASVFLHGKAEPGNGRPADKVLEAFKDSMLEVYPLFDKQIKRDATSIDANNCMIFGCTLTARRR